MEKRDLRIAEQSGTGMTVESEKDPIIPVVDVVVVGAQDFIEGVERVQQLVDAGAAINHDMWDKIQNGHFGLPLPMTIYSAAVIFPLVLAPTYLEQQSRSWLWRISLKLPLILLCLMTVYLQVFLVLYVFEISMDNDYSCGAVEDHHLRFLCLLVFTFTMATDLDETKDIFLWVAQHPDSNEDTVRLSEKGLGKLLYRYRTVRADLGDLQGVEFKVAVPVTGPSRGYRLVIYMVVFCKAAVEIGLLFGGSGYVATASSKEGMIVNTVAMGFIGEIDQVVYNAFTPQPVRAALSSLPQLGLVGPSPSSGDAQGPLASPLVLLDVVPGAWMKPIFTVLSALASMYWWCGHGEI